MQSEMDSQSDAREIEVNVVSSPDDSSRNNSPEPDYRLVNHMAPSNTITCFPLIKTGEDENIKTNSDNVKATPTSKTAGTSTNFSISSILSRTEPSAKKNGFLGSGVPAGTPQNILESAMATNCPDSAMLSR